jgi:hypothetical protein
MTVASNISTVEQLLAAGDIGRCELIDGELALLPGFTMRLAEVFAD